MSQASPDESLTYKAAGVDIDEGAKLVRLIAPDAKRTARPGSDAALGGFGAAFDLKAAGFQDPILVATTDGVGTKVKIAIETGRHDGIGIDLVAMCVNDLLAQGAEPLLFLDYYATAKLDAEAAAHVIRSIAKGCLEAGCALAGGETAEMPGLYAPGDYDLAGFALGAAERGRLLPDLSSMKAGNVILGLSSSGPHSNGYSLLRAIVRRAGLSWGDPCPFSPGRSLAEVLLEPTRIYVRSVLPLVKAGLVLGGAHITGGGLTENMPRVLPKSLRPEIDYALWRAPAWCAWAQEAGSIPTEDLRRTFNCGIGFATIVAEENSNLILGRLADAGEQAQIIGRLVDA